MSAGIIGIASFYIINKEFYLKKLPDPIYCGFCRNVERRNYTFYRLVIAAGILRACFYQKFVCWGGKLGTIAFEEWS
jgi:hypothetical protein